VMASIKHKKIVFLAGSIRLSLLSRSQKKGRENPALG